MMHFKKDKNQMIKNRVGWSSHFPGFISDFYKAGFFGPFLDINSLIFIEMV